MRTWDPGSMLPIPVKRTLLGNHVEGAHVPCSGWVWDTRVTPGRLSVGTGDSRTDRSGPDWRDARKCTCRFAISFANRPKYALDLCPSESDVPIFVTLLGSLSLRDRWPVSCCHQAAKTMWNELGANAFAFLQCRGGFVGNVIADSIMSLSPSPGSPGTPLVRLARLTAHNWMLRRHPATERACS